MAAQRTHTHMRLSTHIQTYICTCIYIYLCMTQRHLRCRAFMQVVVGFVRTRTQASSGAQLFHIHI